MLVKKLLTKILDRIGVDCVVEQGMNGAWFYRKWRGGTVELSIQVSGSGSPVGDIMGGYYDYTVLTYPFEVLEVYYVSGVGKLGTGLGMICGYDPLSTTSGRVYVMGNQNKCIGWVKVHILGRWK